MRADLSLQQAPPFSVPARFLVSAPLFGLFAALTLLWYGPDVISHRWTPQILAVTHFLTLGFLAMSMLGAMLQLLPVLMGMVVPRPVLFSTFVHTPLFLGSLCLGLAWLLQIDQLFIIAIVLTGFSFAVFIFVATDRLLRSASRHVTRSMMLLALLALFVTTGIGTYLAMGHGMQDFALTRELTDLHLSWGLFGWVLTLIMAVAYQVIPMFQITDEYPVLHQRLMGWTIFASLLGLSSTYLMPSTWPVETIRFIFSLPLAGCLVIFSLATLRVLKNRRRQLADTTMRFWQLAMISLLLLTISWLIPSLINSELPVFLLGVLMIHGFAMTTINGMMYKIIPFIIWLHLSVHNKNLRDKGERSSQVKVPHMRKIIPENASLWQFRFHLSSLILLVLATMWPSWFYYPATLVFAAAQTFLLFNLFTAVRFYNIKLAELSDTFSKRV